MKKKKLVLKKETITKLTDEGMSAVKGGEYAEETVQVNRTSVDPWVECCVCAPVEVTVYETCPGCIN
ncbi:MAG: class I lanthipeptide [Tannerellaceae bacterium]|nr:class I lanthipeptide [Tannerellaceae bacterium]